MAKEERFFTIGIYICGGFLIAAFLFPDASINNRPAAAVQQTKTTFQTLITAVEAERLSLHAPALYFAPGFSEDILD